jgi:hypothetical protein
VGALASPRRGRRSGCCVARGQRRGGAPVLSRQQPISVGERVITLDRLEHWARIVARTTGRRPVAADFQEAASFLVDSTWIEAEAELRRIEVSDALVERDLRRQIRESFPGGRGFRHFLRVSGQKRADLVWRVRVRLLSDAIRRQVIGEAKTPRGQQRRVDRFLGISRPLALADVLHAALRSAARPLRERARVTRISSRA